MSRPATLGGDLGQAIRAGDVRMGGMTSSTADAPDAKKEGLLGLSASKVVGGSLAAMTTAVLASRLGVNGTVVGAAFGSTVSAVAGAVYTHSIGRARDQVVVVTKERLSTKTVRPGGDVEETDAEVTTVAPADTATSEQSEEEAAAAPPPDEPPRRRGWRPWLFAGVALFVAVMLTITLIETFLGRPISGGTEQGTTISQVWGEESSGSSQTPTVEESAVPSGESSPSASTDVSPAPVEASPGDTGTSEPSPSTESVPTTEPVPADGGVAPSGG